MNNRKRPSARFPKLLERAGLVAPDTPFNRRAAAYAENAAKIAARRRHEANRKSRLAEKL